MAGPSHKFPTTGIWLQLSRACVELPTCMLYVIFVCGQRCMLPVPSEVFCFTSPCPSLDSISEILPTLMLCEAGVVSSLRAGTRSISSPVASAPPRSLKKVLLNESVLESLFLSSFSLLREAVGHICSTS